jgi:hypothetical protein
MSDTPVPVMFSDFFGNERGNTFLVTEDGNFIAWLDLQDGYMLEVGCYLENYPSLFINPTKISAENLAGHINEYCAGYYIRKCHVPGVRYYEEGSATVVADIEDNSEIVKLTEGPLVV